MDPDRPVPRRGALVLALAALWLLALHPAAAQPCPEGAVCFDDLASPSAASAADLDPLRIVDALVLSEAGAALALGVPTAGTFATSGDQGLLNALEPRIVFELGGAARRFEIDVLALFDASGSAVTVRAEAFAGAAPVASALTDPGRIGDSGFPEDVLRIEAAGGFDRVVLRAELALEETTTFWLDTLRLEPVPEPGTALLLLSGVAALALRRPGGRR